jgi:small ligand-binding sensory domain FIST
VKWFSAASDQADSVQAVEMAAARLLDQTGGSPPDLLLVFASQHHIFHYGMILPLLQERISPQVILGCSAGAVIGGGLEIEQRPGLSLTAIRLPQVDHRLIHVTQGELPALDGSPQPWRDLVGIDPADEPQLLILADPYSIDTGKLLQGLDYAYPNSPKIGGLASGSQGPGGNAIFLDQQIACEGAAVLAFTGDIAIDTVVAQGCRPVGQPMRVTSCEGHLLQELDDGPPIAKLQALLGELSEKDQELARNALFLGVVMDEMREEIGHGDFLIRNILGMHQESGMIAVGTQLRPGQTVQFHLRDGAAAGREVETLLEKYQNRSEERPVGALLFSCMGRGYALFGEPDHDSRCFREKVAPVPIAGFFCNGEIGPVAGQTHLHGYTSAFGIFRPRSAD